MIYNKSGELLEIAYDASGNELSFAYDKDGNVIYNADEQWNNEVSINKYRDNDTGTNYYVIRIPQTRMNGSKQFPFLYVPNGTGRATESTLEMNIRDRFYLAINAGIGGTYPVEDGVLPIGCLIQNGTLIQQGQSVYPILTIDDNGLLNYAAANTNGSTLISSGVVSAVVGFVPIIVDYVSVDPSVYEIMPHEEQQTQRQIIGQYSNGDYCIVTCEGKGFDNSSGWTIPQAITIMLSLGVRFAYNLDGGGSAETVVGDQQLNTIYEGTTGRIVPTYIVFNGTDRFFVPIHKEEI